MKNVSSLKVSQGVETSSKDAGMIRERIQRARDNFTTYVKPKFEKNYKDFRDNGDERMENIKKLGGEDWMSNLFVPVVSSTIRTIHPRAIDSRPQMLIVGRTPNDNKRSSKIQAMAEYTWEKAQIDRQVRKWVHQALTFGSGIGKVIWKVDKRKIKYFKGTNDDGKVEWEEDLVTFYDDNKFEAIDVLGSFWPDPNTKSGEIEDMGYCCHRELLSKEKVQNAYGITLTKSNGRGQIDRYDKVRLDISMTYNKDKSKRQGGGQDQDRNDLWEVIEYWEKDRYVLVIGDEIFRDHPNPFRHKRYPFVKIDYEELPFEFYGQGVASQLEQVQAGINSVRNQRIDNVTMMIHKMFIIDPTAMVNENELRVRPFGMIRSVNPKAVVPIEFGDVKQSAFLEDDKFMEAVKMATGIDDYSRGLGGPASSSATAVTFAKESTLERIKLFVKNLEDGYSDMMRIMLSNMQQFYDDENFVRVLEDGKEEQTTGIDRQFRVKDEKGNYHFPIIKEDDIKGEFDFVIISNSTLASSKELKRKKLFDIHDRYPVTGQGVLDTYKLWEMTLKELDYEPESFLMQQNQNTARSAALDPSQSFGLDQFQQLQRNVLQGEKKELTSGQQQGNLLTEAVNT